jgi:hypothetical protein
MCTRYVFHSYLWQSLFKTQFKRTQIIFVQVKRTSYVCDNFQSINCVKYVLGYISRSMQFDYGNCFVYVLHMGCEFHNTPLSKHE